MNCSKCGSAIGPDDPAYCKGCMDGGTKATAKALGLDESASAEQVRERSAALLKFEGHILAATGAKNLDGALAAIADDSQFRARGLAATGAATADEAHGVIVAAMESHKALPGVQKDLATAQATLIRRDLRATLEKGLDDKRISLGTVQTMVPLFVADETKREAMLAAFSALPVGNEKNADGTAKEPGNFRDAVLDAACSIEITAADLRAIQGYAKVAQPVVAQPVKEPERTPDADVKKIDEVEDKVAKLATEARATLDRQRTPKKPAK